MNKITKVAMVAFSLMFLKSVTVHAQIVDNQTVGKYKAWTIKFNKTVKFDDTVKNKVHVFDNKHNIISVSVNKGNSDNEILVSPPSGGYNLGEEYTLNVQKDIYSTDNKNLNNDVNMNFSINEAESSNANLVNGGEIASDGEWLYYSSSDGLYKIKSDGTGNFKLSKDTAKYINVSDGWVYFVNNDDRKIYKVKSDGTGPYKVSDVQVKEIYVQGDYIYYHNYNGPGEYVSKMKVDGTGAGEIGNSDIFEGEFALDGSYIYCNNGGTVNKIKTDAVSGDAGTTIINNVTGPLYIYDGMIYYGLHSSDYISKFNLGRANEDGTAASNLNIKNLNCVNFLGDSIYYSADENNTLYKANLDGSNPVKIGQGINNFYILGNQIYYINSGDNSWHKMNLDGSQDSLLNFNPYNEGNTSGNLTNSGAVASDGEWIYYSNRLDAGKLYKIRPDGTDNFKLSDKTACNINVSNGWIYFMPLDSQYIYKIKSDGTGPYKVSDTTVQQFCIQGDWIYYYDGQNPGRYICKMKIDGTGMQQLNEPLYVGSFSVSGDWIFYREEGSSIYKMKTDGSSSSQIPSAHVDSAPFTIGNGWVYYTARMNEDLYCLCRYKLDGTGKEETVINKNVNSINGANNFLYYSYGTALYKSNGDGTNETKLFDANQRIYESYIIGNSVYFYTEDNVLHKINTDGSNHMTLGN